MRALIEQEARRRAEKGGYAPEMPSNLLSTFDDDTPIWEVYARKIEADIAELEAGGFVVSAPPSVSAAASVSAAPSLRHWGASCFMGGVILVILWLSL